MSPVRAACQASLAVEGVLVAGLLREKIDGRSTSFLRTAPVGRLYDLDLEDRSFAFG